jgi:folate-binding protein YgfZ
MSGDSCIPLNFLAAIRASGPDAANFLQGQLTQDIRRLADARTLLAAYNTPQGRVVAILRLKQASDAIYGLLPAPVAEPLLARLRKFVLRSRLVLELDPERTPVLLRGEATADSVVIDYAPDRRVALLPRPGPQVSAAVDPVSVERDWWTADIVAGLPQVLAASSEQYVAQMLNLDRLDAISFSKGCYTGQEIVARTQHLGRIKRRSLRYRIRGGPAPTALAPLFLDGTKVGEVLMSAARDDLVELLAVTALDARDRTLRTEDGRDAEPVPLPYALEDPDST